jgi:hypothetical protein
MTALPETAVGTYQRLADLPLVIESSDPVGFR